MILKSFNVDKLKVHIHDTRVSMGEQVAHEFAAYLRELLEKKEKVNVIFAAAPSQADFLDSLTREEGIDWKRVNVFHMDEYIGISIEQEQSFARFVKTLVADKLGAGNFFALNGAQLFQLRFQSRQSFGSHQQFFFHNITPSCKKII